MTSLTRIRSSRVVRLLSALWVLYPAQVLFGIGAVGLLVMAIGPGPGSAHVADDGHRIQAVSITPITAVSDGASGLTFSGDMYDVNCTTTAAASVLYPAVHNGTAWTVYTQSPCTNDGTVTKITCPMAAKRASGLTWNVLKTGAATVNGCTAEERFNSIPVVRQPASSSVNLAAPGPIGGTTPAAGSFTALSATGGITSTSGAVDLTSSGAGINFTAGGGNPVVFTVNGQALFTLSATLLTVFNGTLAMGNGKVTGLAAGSAAGDAVRYEQGGYAIAGGSGLSADTIGAATRYLGVIGQSAQTTQVPFYVLTRALTIRNLQSSLRVAPGGADTVVFTVAKSSDQATTWSNTSMTCTITGASKSCSDTTHTASLSAGDWISEVMVSSAGTAAGPLSSVEAI